MTSAEDKKSYNAVLSDPENEKYFVTEEDSDGEDRPYWCVEDCLMPKDCKQNNDTQQHWNAMWGCRSYISSECTMNYVARHLINCGHHAKDGTTAIDLAGSAIIEEGVQDSAARAEYRKMVRQSQPLKIMQPEAKKIGQHRNDPQRNDERRDDGRHRRTDPCGRSHSRR